MWIRVYSKNITLFSVWERGDKDIFSLGSVFSPQEFGRCGSIKNVGLKSHVIARRYDEAIS
jgi:hypothetical protein